MRALDFHQIVETKRDGVVAVKLHLGALKVCADLAARLAEKSMGDGNVHVVVGDLFTDLERIFEFVERLFVVAFKWRLPSESFVNKY